MRNGCRLIKTYDVGYCSSWGALADRNLPWKRARFYARSFLIEHPVHGLILVDTGYGEALIKATERGVSSLYSKLLPITYCSEDSVRTQLALDGISTSDLSYLLISHFHPDHIGALPEFSDRPWIYRQEPLHRLLRCSLLGGLRRGFFHTLIPPVPPGSVPVFNAQFRSMWHKLHAFDLFGDQSLYLIDLPGHALGQMGVAIGNQLLAADALWSPSARPHPLTYLVQEAPLAYAKTQRLLRALPQSIHVIPTHRIEFS